MKLPIVSILILALFTSGCFLTNSLGIAPQDSVTGTEAKKGLGNVFAVSWTLACGLYAKDVSSCTSNTNFGKNFLMANILAPALSSIDDSKFYRKKSVEECYASVSNFTRMFGFSYLKSKEQRVQSGGTFVTFISQDDLDQSVLLLGLMAPTFCKPDETGQVIEIGGNGF
mgnify:FL=1